MSTNSRPANVAILAFPEVGVSTVYGMFDMFSSAGRDWGFILDGKPGDSLIAPRWSRPRASRSPPAMA